MILKQSIIDNWSDALKKIAIEENKVDIFIKQSDVLVQLLKNQDEFIRILSSNKKDFKNEQIKIIDNTFLNQGININIINAMKLLVEFGLFRYSKAIFKSLNKQLLDFKNIVVGTIWSVEKLTDKQIKIIELKIIKKINKNVNLINKLDSKLIGGVKVIVDDTIFDGSIKGKIDELKYETLLEK